MSFHINNKTYFTFKANDFSSKGDIVNICKASQVYDQPKCKYWEKTPALLSKLTNHRFIIVHGTDLTYNTQDTHYNLRINLRDYTKKAIALIVYRAGLYDEYNYDEFISRGEWSKQGLLHFLQDNNDTQQDINDLYVFAINTEHRITQRHFTNTNNEYIHPRPIHRLTLQTPPPPTPPTPPPTPPPQRPPTPPPTQFPSITKVDDNILPHHIAIRLLSKDDNCIVCLDDLSNDTIVVTKCGHFYCKECLAITISLDNPKCGECRNEFK